MNIKNNPYRSHRVEFHILQAFPVTCLNRDDVGSPKTAVVGGVTRARVSSQCWKRAVRLALQEVGGVKLGSRTKLLSTLIANDCMKLGASEEQAKKCGEKIERIFIKKLDAGKEKKKDEDAAESSGSEKSDTLIFLSPKEVRLVAEKFRDADFLPEKVITQTDAKKQAKELGDLLGKGKKETAENLDGIDIVLFGRMVAQAPSMDVEAAASFSHAISTHKVTNEVEFFTAIDDESTEQGSAHMGSLEFNSATYYRYISLDLGQLYESLGGDEFFSAAISAFIRALYSAVPTARQTTQSGASSWDYAKVLVRKGQRIQLSFETPVAKESAGGFLQPSIRRLQEELTKKENLSGSLFGKIAEFEFGLDESFSVDNLVAEVTESVKV